MAGSSGVRGVCWSTRRPGCRFFFFFNDTATTEIYTLSLHDALPIFQELLCDEALKFAEGLLLKYHPHLFFLDRKSTRLNSSHGYISYAVFCLKKKQPNGRERPAARLRSPARRHPARGRCHHPLMPLA